jgi:hypothetical protein
MIEEIIKCEILDEINHYIRDYFNQGQEDDANHDQMFCILSPDLLEVVIDQILIPVSAYIITSFAKSLVDKIKENHEHKSQKELRKNIDSLDKNKIKELSDKLEDYYLNEIVDSSKAAGLSKSQTIGMLEYVINNIKKDNINI